MFLKSFSSILIVTSAFVLAIGQTPEAPKEKERTRSFAFSFDGDGGYLGVQTQEVTKENFAKFGLSSVRGVVVEKVVENSPAAAAGLQAGDVILKFDGEEVTSTRKLTRLIGEVAPDHQVKITVVRGGREQDVTATLGKRPAPRFADGNFLLRTPMPPMPPMPEFKEFPRGEMPRVFTVPGADGETLIWRSGEGRVIGVGVTPLTKQLAAHYGVESGALITEVRENSPAAKAGLKAGDIIVEVDGKAVKRDIDIVKAVNAKKEGDVTLTIVRNGNRQTITVTPEKSKDSGFVFETEDNDNGMFTRSPIPNQMRLAAPTISAPMFTGSLGNLAFPGRLFCWL